MSDVELRGVHKRYGSVTAVESLDLRVQAGEFVSLLGPSGCGKTTTLRMIAGLIRPDAGDVVIAGRSVNHVPVHRRGLGLVAQNYALFPHMSVLDNVTFGLRMRNMATAEARRKAMEALEIVRLTGMEGRYPRQLSGGQQQRVALARCIVVEPAVLLLDEPLGALDKKLRETMQVELKLLQRQLGITTVFVTHDQEEALTMSDRIAVMNRGRLEQYGTPEEVYEAPRNRFVSDFIGVCNFLEGQVVERDNGTLAVQTDGGLLMKLPASQAPEGLSQGSRVIATVRPEKVLLHANGAPAGDSTTAILEAAVYLGTAIHYHLRTPGGERLVAYRQSDATAPRDLQTGAEVVVSWEPQAVRILAE
jgi:spermidine/putrescine ABC transporter ATP-binding subunit